MKEKIKKYLSEIANGKEIRDKYYQNMEKNNLKF